MTEPVKVIQADRDAAAKVHEAMYGITPGLHFIQSGERDHETLVQTLARRRLSATEVMREAADCLDLLLTAWVEGKEISDDEGRRATSVLMSLNRALNEGAGE